MARWSVVLPPPVEQGANYVVWGFGLGGAAYRIPAALVDAGAEAYLLSLELDIRNEARRNRLGTGATTGYAPGDEGVDRTDLSAALEASAVAITLVSAEGSLTVPGPAAAGSVAADDAELYIWRHAASYDAAISAWTAAYQGGQVTLTLDDGVAVRARPEALGIALGLAAGAARARPEALGIVLALAAPAAPPLELGSFPTSGLQTVVLGLIEAGPAPNVYRAPENGGPVGTLGGGSDMELRPGQDITRIAIFLEGAQLRIWDNPSADALRGFFGRGGAGADLTVYIQTGSGLATGAYVDAGNNYANFAFAGADRALLAGIAEGDAFNLAFAGDPARASALGIALGLAAPAARDPARASALGIALGLAAPAARDPARPSPLGIALALSVPSIRIVARPSPLPIGLGLPPPRVLPKAVAMALGIGLGLGSPAFVNPAARYGRALRESAPEHALLTALEISHPAVAVPVRVINDTEGRRIEGNEYVALRFDARLADDVDGQAPQAELGIDNVGRELTQWIEAAQGGVGATVRVMLVLDVDDPPVEWEVTLDVAGMAIDQERVTARLGFDPLLGRAAVALRHDPQTSPGLF